MTALQNQTWRHVLIRRPHPQHNFICVLLHNPCKVTAFTWASSPPRPSASVDPVTPSHFLLRSRWTEVTVATDAWRFWHLVNVNISHFFRHLLKQWMLSLFIIYGRRISKSNILTVIAEEIKLSDWQFITLISGISDAVTFMFFWKSIKFCHFTMLSYSLLFYKKNHINTTAC